jgi:hypothetical protein
MELGAHQETWLSLRNHDETGRASGPVAPDALRCDASGWAGSRNNEGLEHSECQGRQAMNSLATQANPSQTLASGLGVSRGCGCGALPTPLSPGELARVASRRGVTPMGCGGIHSATGQP